MKREVVSSKTGNVEVLHEKDSDMIPDKSVAECKAFMRHALWAQGATHRSVLEDDAVRELGKNNTSRIALAMIQMRDDGEVVEDEDGVFLLSKGKNGGVKVTEYIQVDEDFDYGERRFKAGSNYKVPEDISEAAAEQALKEELAHETEKLEEPPEEKEVKKVKPAGEPEEAEAPEGESKWDRMKRKAKEESPTPPHWNPDIDDWLMGTIVSTGMGTKKGENRFAEVEVAENPVKSKEKSGKNKKGKTTYESTETEPGDTVLLWERTSLKDLFDQIRAGMDISIQYIGTKESGKGNPAMLFDWYLDKKGS